MRFLSVAGTVAMFLVGGGILAHGVAPLHHAIAALSTGSLGWLWGALLNGGVGVLAGALLVAMPPGPVALARQVAYSTGMNSPNGHAPFIFLTPVTR